MIELAGVDKYYNYKMDTQVHALKNINLTIEDGEFVAVIGVSGSGKSTLLHIIGCLDTPTNGKFILGEYETAKYDENTLSEIRNEEIGFVLQNFGLLPDKTVYENISYPLLFNPAVKYKMLRKLIKKAADDMLIGDLLHKKVSELSGGQKQRTALARAIVNRPDVILADEPTAALDKKTAFEIMDVFERLNEAGKTIIIVTHDRNIAARCKRVIELADGEIVRDSKKGAAKLQQ